MQQQAISTPKAQLLQLLSAMPDDSSYEDLEYEMYVRHKIRAGMKDYEEGKVFTLDEVKQQAKKWLDA